MAQPLEKQDLDDINAALAAIKSARQVITRAKTANIDVSAQEAQMNESEARLLSIKQGFFPGGRA